MTTVDVTAEEIEDAPLLINPQLQEVKPDTRTRLNFVLCIVLAINTLLQLIAIVTPGWNVVRSDTSSSYESVYYTVGCVDTTPLENVSTTSCATVTFLDDFSERYNAAKDTIKPAIVSVYNLQVRYQINIQYSWLAVFATTIFQIVRYIKRYEAYPKLTAINAMILICACSAMYQALYEAAVKIDFSLRESEQSMVKVGFPYSVLLYLVSSIQTCACTVLVLKQIYDYIRHIKLVLMQTKVQVDTLQKQYDLEVEEFKHYRLLHSDKTRMKGRSRKSQAVDRRSQRGDNRINSQRNSKRRRDFNDNSENRNNQRHRESSHGRSSRERSIKDRLPHHVGHSAHSGASRDSSPTPEIPGQRGTIEDTADDSTILPENLLESSENSEIIPEFRRTLDLNLSRPLKIQTDRETRQAASGLQNSAAHNSIAKRQEIVSAEIHIPSIDGIEIED